MGEGAARRLLTMQEPSKTPIKITREPTTKSSQGAWSSASLVEGEMSKGCDIAMCVEGFFWIRLSSCIWLACACWGVSWWEVRVCLSEWVSLPVSLSLSLMSFLACKCAVSGTFRGAKQSESERVWETGPMKAGSTGEGEFVLVTAWLQVRLWRGEEGDLNSNRLKLACEAAQRESSKVWPQRREWQKVVLAAYPTLRGHPGTPRRTTPPRWL